MGGRSSPGLFYKFSDTVEWLCINNYGLPHTCHLLDNFLCVEPQSRKGEALNTVTSLSQLRDSGSAS